MLDMEPVSLDFPSNLEGEKTWGVSGAVTNSSAHQTIQNMQRIEHRKGRIIKVPASLCIFRQKRTRQTAQRRRARAGRPLRLRRRFHLHPRPPRHRPRHRPRRRQRRRQRCRQRCWQRCWRAAPRAAATAVVAAAGSRSSSVSSEIVGATVGRRVGFGVSITVGSIVGNPVATSVIVGYPVGSGDGRLCLKKKKEKRKKEKGSSFEWHVRNMRLYGKGKLYGSALGRKWKHARRRSYRGGLRQRDQKEKR